MPGVAACVDEAVKAAIVATPANTMPATVKPPIVPSNFDFKVLCDILIPPYSPLWGLLFALVGVVATAAVSTTGTRFMFTSVIE
jgi:hypothetical protein